MNDFTKDELQDLLFCVKDHSNYQGDSIHNNLISKIQDMIYNKEKQENCTHEWKYEFNDYHCLKCELRK